jgi:hypothetical protein
MLGYPDGQVQRIRHMRPVRCILEEIPTRGERFWRFIARLLFVGYFITASFFGFGKALDIYSEYNARVEMAKKINNGDFVNKKGKKR